MRYRKWSQTTTFPGAGAAATDHPRMFVGVRVGCVGRGALLHRPEPVARHQVAATDGGDLRPPATSPTNLPSVRGPNPRRFDNNSTGAPLSPSVEPDSLVRSMRHRKWSQTTRFPASKQPLLTTSWSSVSRLVTLIAREGGGFETLTTFAPQPPEGVRSSTPGRRSLLNPRKALGPQHWPAQGSPRTPRGASSGRR